MIRSKPLAAHHKGSGDVGERFDAIIASSGLAGRRANPKVMLGGLGIVVVGALAGGLAFGSGRDSHRILVAARPIEAGTVMSASDVRTIDVSGTPGFASIGPGDLNRVVGRVAGVPIGAGNVITADVFRARQSAPDGSGLVGVVLDPGALPTPDLRYGDVVEVMVSTSPNAVIDEPARIVSQATVWKVWAGVEGATRRTVTLAVPADKVPEVGDAAARNLIRLVVIPTPEPDPTDTAGATGQQWPDIPPRTDTMPASTVVQP
jgi:hypothetical protein